MPREEKSTMKTTRFYNICMSVLLMFYLGVECIFRILVSLDARASLLLGLLCSPSGTHYFLASMLFYALLGFLCVWIVVISSFLLCQDLSSFTPYARYGRVLCVF